MTAFPEAEKVEAASYITTLRPVRVPIIAGLFFRIFTTFVPRPILNAQC